MSGTCYPCPSLCGVCSEINKCTSCVDNASMTNGQCLCSEGYFLVNNTCEAVYFYAFMLVNFVGGYNKLILSFSEAVASQLNASDFSISVSGPTPSSVVFYKKDSQNYSFKLAFATNVLADTPVSLSILLNPLVSASNSRLKNYVLSGSLFSCKPVNPSDTGIASGAAAAAQSSVTVAVGAGMISNPAAAWALINTIQIISYIPLNSNPLTPNLQTFCTAMNNFNLIPNPMAFIFNSSSTSEPYTEASNYGMNTSVFWINIGQDLIMIFGMIAIWPFVFLLSKLHLGKITKRLLKVSTNYKYSVFIRFWIQSYLDFGIYSLVQLKAVIFI